MTTPTKIEGLLSQRLEGMIRDLAEHVWRESGGFDWVDDPIDQEHVQIILDEWIEKNFSRIVEDKLDELVEERKEAEERERREEEETQKETSAWLQRGIC
jgi:hypothetical protein